MLKWCCPPFWFSEAVVSLYGGFVEYSFGGDTDAFFDLFNADARVLMEGLPHVAGKEGTISFIFRYTPIYINMLVVIYNITFVIVNVHSFQYYYMKSK